MTRYTLAALPLLLTLTACPNATPSQQAAISVATNAAVTLGTIAAQNNTTADAILKGGQLLCAFGPSVAAIAGINVVGTLGSDMQKVCAALGGVGTGALPAGTTAASVPVIAAPAVAIKPAGV